MGFLGNLDKINTLELFLTDKGKELMLKENGLGLYDLISRFSLDDADYDYRRTSNVWVDGISPVPDGSLLPFGTTQSLSNNTGGPIWFDNLSVNNPCRSCEGTECTPLSGDCWYDMPDVRGDRGNKIINCYSSTAQTQGVQACTNIYAFYDTTSVLATDAEAAKLGLNQWFSTLSATTPNFNGKLFHIPVMGERWINTSYYPWNGKLDTWDWTPCGNGVAGSPLGYNCNSRSATFLGVTDGPTDPSGEPLYREAVTGLCLQVDDAADTGLSTGDWTGFAELPPNASVGIYGQGSGGRAEFWTTGCTLVPEGSPGYGYNNTALSTITAVGFTAYSANNIVWDVNAFSGTTWSAYTPNDMWIPSGYIPQAGTSSQLTAQLTQNLCQDNCCPSNYPDLGYEGPGLFGCQECNPFDNTITSGRLLSWTDKGLTYSYLGVFSAGTMDLIRFEETIDCVKYRGMDRNVLIIDVFDETQAAEPGGTNNYGKMAGILPLGDKSYYNGTDGNAANLTTTTLGDPAGQTTSPQTNPNFFNLDNMGYHGKSNIGSSGIGYPTGDSSDWDASIPGMIAARVSQPTEDWKYSQDLFLKTHGLYENFQGFVYPVVPLLSSTPTANSSKMFFPLHLYGAIYGDVVPQAEFQDNPTVVLVGGTLSACTVTNPYDTLVPVTYDPTLVTQTSLNSDGNYEPFPSHTFTDGQAITPISPYTTGLRNWGWNFNPTVGCNAWPCNVGDIFSGGTFQSDLNSFITGSSFFITTITSASTECQCLPAVFINKKGPIEVIDEGCPCPDGTISEECCGEDPNPDPDPNPDNEITQGICGPLPSTPSNGGRPSGVIGQSGISTGPPKTPINDLYVPKSYTNFTSGLNEKDTGIGATLPPLRTTSKFKNYSSFYTADFDINLKQYYENNELKWDVEFESTSRYGNRLIQEGDGSKFYWIVSSGYKTSTVNPKETKACISPTISTINLNKRYTQGINIAYLKGYWNESNSENYISIDTTHNGPNIEKIKKYEFCVTMVYTYKSKLLKKTKRFSVIGNDYGYKLKVKT